MLSKVRLTNYYRVNCLFMQLKEYQQNAIDKLTETVGNLVNKAGTRVCVFKSPTGSGKTLMVAKFLQRLVEAEKDKHFSFVWVSVHNLHTQSKDKLEKYLKDTVFSFSIFDDISDNCIKENEILFINWESINKTNRQGQFTDEINWNSKAMKDNERNRNLPTFIKKTKEEGREIILIIDESHHTYLSERSQMIIREIIEPKIVLEVSATPKMEPTAEEIVQGEAGLVVVEFEKVVEEGMIKKEVLINPEFKGLKVSNETADELVIKTAIQKRQDLKKLYEQEGSKINPLVLIQLPSEYKKMSALDRSKMETAKQILRDKFDITIENGKLGIYLSDEKENLDENRIPYKEVEVLIFKQAIAIGWDCPRAQILVMFREAKNIIFEIQTVGRIIRMPEQKHYQDEDLNYAYVYTNLSEIHIKEGIASEYISPHQARIKSIYQPIDLYSIYLHRIDYGSLEPSLEFRRVFFDVANEYFGIDGKKILSANENIKKVKKKLDLSAEGLSDFIMADGRVKNIDVARDVKTKYEAKVKKSFDDTKAQFDGFAREIALPYAPERSYEKIERAIYDWFDNYLGFVGRSRLDIQKIVLLDKNRSHFKKIMEIVKERFREVKEKIMEKRIERQKEENWQWNVPSIDFFNNNYEEVNFNKYILEPCYLRKDRDKAEKNFEKYLDASKEVLWWYKNGEKKKNYFAVPYKMDGILNSFYVDYIVKLKDGRIGLFDPHGRYLKDFEAKNDGLYKYIQKENKKGKKLFGGIVANTDSRLYKGQWKYFNKTSKELKNDFNNWKDLEL